MQAFVDTSALVTLLDLEDEEHPAVAKAWAQLRDESSALVTTNYVVAEASAVCQRRLGMSAARALWGEIVPLLSVSWVDETLHRRAASVMLTANRRDLSLVDCVSFDVMRRLGIQRVFALDEHFREQGFDCLP